MNGRITTIEEKLVKGYGDIVTYITTFIVRVILGTAILLINSMLEYIF